MVWCVTSQNWLDFGGDLITLHWSQGYGCLGRGLYSLNALANKQILLKHKQKCMYRYDQQLANNSKPCTAILAHK